jgi:hypothetical protein
MAETRKAIHAYVSEDAHSSWELFAEENGVSVTGLIEALGHAIAREIATTRDPTDVRQGWVKEARRVDALRRKRTGKRAW